jgi:hypothetical protein
MWNRKDRGKNNSRNVKPCSQPNGCWHDSNAMGAWTAILQVGKEVPAENLKRERSLSPVGVDGKKNLSVSKDACWDKRSAGRRYNSLSGCSVTMGNRSGLIMGLRAMSMCCISCEMKIPHNPTTIVHRTSKALQREWRHQGQSTWWRTCLQMTQYTVVILSV